MKIRQVGVELFHAGRKTDRHEADNCRFSQFCGSSQKGAKLSYNSQLYLPELTSLCMTSYHGS